MKYIQLIILFISIPFVSLSQNKLYKITYSNILDIDTQVKSLDVLYVTEKAAYYEIGKKEIISKQEKKTITAGEVSIVVKQKEKFTSFVYTDRKGNKMYNLIEKQQLYKIVEPIPEMNWVLTDETKLIEEALLYKATLAFRGRNYEAWCNLNIPISVGPWKFNGAPGLIYEIRSLEDDYSYYWSLKDFTEITEDKKIKETFLLLSNKVEKGYRNLQEVVVELDEEDSDNKTISDVRLPEGVFVESTKVESADIKQIRRKRLEIKYEWEE